MWRKARFTTRALLIATIVAAVALGMWFAPRTYVAKVYIGYGSFAFSATPHARFLEYRDANVSDRDLQKAEQDWILSRKVVDEAVKLLVAENVSPEVFGKDPVEWFRRRVVITPMSSSQSHVELTVSHRESGYVGSSNHGRNTLAWKAAVALMKAYQAKCFSSPQGGPDKDNLRLPFCGFHRVKSCLW
jgi:hypothetical protein